MRDFFGKYSYGIIKMIVNQIAISIFGAVLAMATMSADNNVLTAVVSVFAILFYLFLLYNMTWEIGAKDRISVDSGKKPYKPHTGLKMALFANIPNFLIAAAFTVAYPFMSTAKWAGTMAAVTNTVSLFVQGMYRGVLSVITVFTRPLYNYWWTYFVIIIPALLTCWLAYYAGHKNFKFTSFISAKANQDGSGTNKG